MAEKAMAVFDELNALNINGHTETKNVGGKDLTYLSWAWAWAEVKKRYPDAHYNIWRNADGLPYVEDPQTGYMVFTDVTIEGITHMMWLPVMDGANRAMKAEPYSYTVKNPNFKWAKKQPDGRYLDKYGNEQTEFLTKTCDSATMMDINKTLMRCLVKNLAMFGLGLYIYAGEDIPEGEKAPEPEPAGPEFTRPDVNEPKSALAQKVDKAASVPAVPAITNTREVPPAQEANPVTKFLVGEMKILRESRKISAKENNELFKAQKDALIAAGLAPDKSLEEYTMQEAESLVDAMWKCFDPKGTELKVDGGNA